MCPRAPRAASGIWILRISSSDWAVYTPPCPLAEGPEGMNSGASPGLPIAANWLCATEVRPIECGTSCDLLFKLDLLFR